MNCYVHQVPGRIRVKVPHLKNRHACCGKLERALQNHHGVRAATANPLTGSIVVNYDPAAINAENVLAVLKANRYFDEAWAQPVGSYTSKMAADAGAKIGKAVFGWAVGRALDANGLSLLAAFI
ncbi:MAG: HMA2 domain-containing protein [Thermodesulfobacteriota bacterium]